MINLEADAIYIDDDLCVVYSFTEDISVVETYYVEEGKEYSLVIE